MRQKAAIRKVCNEIYWNLLSNELHSNVVAVIVVLLVIGVVVAVFLFLFDAIFSDTVVSASHHTERNGIALKNVTMCVCVCVCVQ